VVQRFLRSIDVKDPVGRRDHAILHLMAHYGLRPGELAHLTLDSIDWPAQTLCVRQTKTHSALLMPLHERTAHVLRDYLQRARAPSALSWLFLRAVAPEAPMSKYSLSYVFRTRARRSGLPLEGYSAYSLRHAFALRLFQRGVGMKAIGDLMGHRSLLSTEVYIRLQTDVLREVALPVPCLEAQAGGVA
jgi:site-specific recombinase XerD